MWVRKNTQRTAPILRMICSILVCTTAQILKMYSEWLGYSLWVHFEYLCCGTYWNWAYHTQYRRRACVEYFTFTVRRSVCLRWVGAGSVCFWEFSGYGPYLVTYDQFIGDPNSVYMIVVSMRDSPAERRRQFHYWLEYLRCRVALVEPVGKYMYTHTRTHTHNAAQFWSSFHIEINGDFSRKSQNFPTPCI